MNIFSWLGKRIRLTDRSFWAAYYGGETWAGEPISPETAMQISAFWACVRLISQTIGTLPLGIYQKMPDGSAKERTDHDLYRLVHDQPNADHTAIEFWEGVGACLCLAGNAFAEKTYAGIGSSQRLVAMTLLNPAFMSVIREADGSLVYRYTGYPQGEVKGQRDYAESDIFHVRGFGIGQDLGLSPIAYARQSLSANRATERAAATTFANGMRPSGWLVFKGGTLTPEQRVQTRANIIEPMSGAENSGKTGILEADFDYRQMTIPPEAAQLLETRAFGVEEVCRIHGVPPVLVGHASTGQTMWGSGIEQILIGWKTLGLNPYLVRIEQAIKRSLIAPPERATLFASFDSEEMLRGDHNSRGEYYWKMVQVGAMSPNQVCDSEGLPRFEGGDVHLINTTLAPLNQAGLPKAALAPVVPIRPAAAAPDDGATLRVIK